jgi:hypothetical protein
MRVVSAVGCDFLSTKAENGGQNQGGGVSAAGSGQNGKEAPELASMVKPAIYLRSTSACPKNL